MHLPHSYIEKRKQVLESSHQFNIFISFLAATPEHSFPDIKIWPCSLQKMREIQRQGTKLRICQLHQSLEVLHPMELLINQWLSQDSLSLSCSVGPFSNNCNQ